MGTQLGELDRNLEELKKQTGAKGGPIGFDMEYVTRVDIEVVRFLNACEKSGIELIRCSTSIREWMAGEQVRKSTHVHKARKEQGNYNECS